MNFIGLEFDRSQFDTTSSCEKYMQGHNDLQHLLKLKEFKLRATKSRFMSFESRTVWSWFSLWEAKNIVVARPTQWVVMIRDTGSDHWTKEDVPIPSEATKEKEKKLELARQKKEVHKREVAERLKKKRKEISERKKSEKPPKKARRTKKPEEDFEKLLKGHPPSVVEKMQDSNNGESLPNSPLNTEFVSI